MSGALQPSEPASGTPSSPAAPHRFAVRVYYEDTDFSGSVYHVSYLRFLERGRTEFLRALGIEHSAIFAKDGADSRHFAVRAMSIEFLKPALMDDSLKVETSLTSTGGASIEMTQKIQRGQEVLLTARIRIAIVAGGKARRIPAEVLERLKEAARPGPQAEL
ncbi:MAG: tol-pal system-associated acyl-CoA thioesterase [Beijerinckiaceae bacterium]|nr:tol-pal system-associated acyl-CoA thioesterase [Beijerinckiaceae bacterium]